MEKSHLTICKFICYSCRWYIYVKSKLTVIYLSCHRASRNCQNSCPRLAPQALSKAAGNKPRKNAFLISLAIPHAVTTAMGGCIGTTQPPSHPTLHPRASHPQFAMFMFCLRFVFCLPQYVGRCELPMLVPRAASSSVSGELATNAVNGRAWLDDIMYAGGWKNGPTDMPESDMCLVSICVCGIFGFAICVQFINSKNI